MATMSRDQSRGKLPATMPMPSGTMHNQSHAMVAGDAITVRALNSPGKWGAAASIRQMAIKASATPGLAGAGDENMP